MGASGCGLLSGGALSCAMRAIRRLNGVLFEAGLALLAKAARRPRLHGFARLALRGLAAASTRLFGVRPAATPAALGAAWQSVFPSRRMVPIDRIDGDTVHAEIHVRCPLRGTGDVHACHRLMEYDRAVAARAGANFVVLRSQAEPGVSVCQVALRRQGLPTEDLVAAHERKAPPSQSEGGA